MKKTKRYDDGGLSSSQKEWLGGADQSDPIIMARMRAAVPDESTKATNYGEQNESPEVSTPKAVERTVVKTKVTPRITGDDTINPDVKMRSAVSEAKKSIGVGSLPKSFKEAGGNTTATKSKADMPSMKISLPDPLSKFNAKGQRTGGKDFELGVKKGGAIKKMADGGSDGYLTPAQERTLKMVKTGNYRSKPNEMNYAQPAPSSNGPTMPSLGPANNFPSSEAYRQAGSPAPQAQKKGGAVKKMASGGRTSASKRADGCATKGFTRG